VVVYARALHTHVFGDVAEIQAALSMRLYGPSGCRQDGFPRVIVGNSVQRGRKV
jgi:hypothetical protein